MAKSLMIVDDSTTMRKIIMRTVRMSGLDFERTEEAGNGVEALEKLNAAPVDIMLCDVNMPEMGGQELVKKVRQMPACAETKIVMVSTETSDEIVDGVRPVEVTPHERPDVVQFEVAPGGHVEDHEVVIHRSIHGGVGSSHRSPP